MKSYLSPLMAVLCLLLIQPLSSQDLSALKGFQQTIKLNAKVKNPNVLAAIEGWFTSHPTLFTNKNAEPPTEAKPKNKLDVEEAYGNRRPLQSLDPAANKILGQGLIKYFGGARTSIRLLYLKYDITIELKAGEALFKVSNLRYFHFVPKNYTDAGIFAFSGGKPCESTGSVDDLLSCQNSPTEFKALADFFQQTVKSQAKALTAELQTKKMLPLPSTKVPDKTAAKKKTGNTVTTQKAVVK